MDLRSGGRYRVEGVLHEYLGPADLPDAQGLAHVFLRTEWRPNTPDQLPFTLVRVEAVDASITRAYGSGNARLATSYRLAVATAGAAVGLAFLLFGASMLRARVLPAWAVVATAVGAIGAGIQFLLPGSVTVAAFLLLRLRLVGLGYGLWASVSTFGSN